LVPFYSSLHDMVFQFLDYGFSYAFLLRTIKKNRRSFYAQRFIAKHKKSNAQCFN